MLKQKHNTRTQNLTSKPQFLPNNCTLPQHRELRKPVIPILFATNSRARRCTVLPTAEQTSRNHHQGCPRQAIWLTCSAVRQRLRVAMPCSHPQGYSLWSRSLGQESKFFEKKKGGFVWEGSTSRTQHRSAVPLANCQCDTNSHWSSGKEKSKRFKDNNWLLFFCPEHGSCSLQGLSPRTNSLKIFFS